MVAASAGNSARGMPNTIAFRSTRKVPNNAGWRRAKRSPSISDDQPGATVPPAGSSVGSPSATSTAIANPAAAAT